jgi:DNA-binding CsgD family transcriptional regulator
LSNPEIAARMQLSRRTVATHVSHILKKLDGHSRTDIAREAAQAHEEAARARQRGFLARRSARRSIAEEP